MGSFSCSMQDLLAVACVIFLVACGIFLVGCGIFSCGMHDLFNSAMQDLCCGMWDIFLFVACGIILLGQRRRKVCYPCLKQIHVRSNQEALFIILPLWVAWSYVFHNSLESQPEPAPWAPFWMIAPWSTCYCIPWSICSDQPTHTTLEFLSPKALGCPPESENQLWSS